MSEVPMTSEERALRERLRTAVRNTETPPFLEARVRAHLRSQPRRAAWRGWALAATAAMTLLVAGVAYQLGHLRWTTASQDAYIADVSNRVATLMRVGLKDHIHCAVYRKYPKAAPPVGELVQHLSAEYRGLAPVMSGAVPAEYKLAMAHECRYRGRKYVHLALKSESRLLSLVIARKGEGESFKTENMLPAAVRDGVPVYTAGVQRFQIASFESRDYLVYVISDLTAAQNTEALLAMAPGVRGVLAKLES
ncbi:MAG TPA: hypothetical protein DEH78_24880 [Solibacterales bacterium]|nr:hypothetical protein [Bryobacterales bacterium]